MKKVSLSFIIDNLTDLGWDYYDFDWEEMDYETVEIKEEEIPEQQLTLSGVF